jgi:hypothetical protein
MSTTSSTQTSRLAALEASLAALMEENNRIKAANEEIRAANEAIKTANATLEQRVTALSEQPRGSPTPSNKERTSEPKVASPEFFSGSRQGLTSFFTQVNMVIGLQPSRYPTEKTKVLYAGSFLRGTALLWFQPYVSKTPEDPIMNDFELFCKKLKELFGDPNERATAERNLYALKQKGSATSYLADFQRYSVLVEWNDQAKMAQFYRGLKEMVKDELAKQDDSQTLTELMERAVKIDTRLYERNLEKGSDNSKPYGNFTPRNNTYNKGDNSGKPDGKSDRNKPNLTANGRLPKEEYKRRRDNKLCLYCGSSDHTIANCPENKSKFKSDTTPTPKSSEQKDSGKA